MTLKRIALCFYRSRLGKLLFNLLPDSVFLRIQYRSIMGKNLNLSDPKGFNEKLQWLKLHDRKSEYSIYADKYAVRNFIRDTIGEQYLVKLLGMWTAAEDIKFDDLPEKFVIKGSHDSGSVIVCRNKKKLDVQDTIKKMKLTLLKNNFYYGRDWPYKNIMPRIIAEEYLESGPEGLTDYKFYCFDGIPKFLYISSGLENHSAAHITFYDMEGKRMPFQRADYPVHEIDPPLPSQFEKMKEIAEVLARRVNAPFVRIDLYCVNDKIYFSEITFRPCSGYMRFNPLEWDEKVGNLINLK